MSITGMWHLDSHLCTESCNSHARVQESLNKANFSPERAVGESAGGTARGQNRVNSTAHGGRADTGRRSGSHGGRSKHDLVLAFSDGPNCSMGNVRERSAAAQGFITHCIA